MTTLYEGADAKLNLTLDVLGKREDGYHELETVMFPVRGLYDELTVCRAEGDGVTADFTDSEGIKDAFYHEDRFIGLAEDI